MPDSLPPRDPQNWKEIREVDVLTRALRRADARNETQAAEIKWRSDRMTHAVAGLKSVIAQLGVKTPVLLHAIRNALSIGPGKKQGHLEVEPAMLANAWHEGWDACYGGESAVCSHGEGAKGAMLASVWHEGWTECDRGDADGCPYGEGE